MMPSLEGVVKDIKKARFNWMALTAGGSLIMASMMVIPSVVQAYDEQMGNYGQYGGMSSPNNGFGGDYPAYSDGGYGGYPVDDYQNQNNPGQLISSPSYGLDTPYRYNGMWNSLPTPSPAPADLQGNGNMPVGQEVPLDNQPPVDNGAEMTPPPTSDENQPTELIPTPSPAPQAVATANATAKVIIEKSAPRATSQMSTSTYIPAELPATGADMSIVASSVGVASIVAAGSYYLNSRRELRLALLKR